MTIDNLCIKQFYRFSAYLANAEKILPSSTKPDVRFEVRTTTADGKIIAQFNTGDILQYEMKLTWWQCGISFNASDSSLVLLIISNIGHDIGNDLIIDDIELEVLPMTNLAGYCISGQSIDDFSLREMSKTSSLELNNPQCHCLALSLIFPRDYYTFPLINLVIDDSIHR